MKLYNICTKKHYEKEGQHKTKWYKVGFLKVAESGKQYIKLFHQPETEYYVFDHDAVEEKPEA